MSNLLTCYSRGCLASNLLIVGQSPGKEESTKIYEDSKTNRSARIPVPFSGPAGILLMSIMERVDIREGDYVMTNTVKFYPTDEAGKLRPPTQQEIEEGRPMLINEILILRPKLIIATGKEAIWSTVFFGREPLSQVKITQLNGRIFDVKFSGGTDERTENVEHECKVLAVFHPSYLRRMQVGDDREYDVTMTKFITAFINNKDLIDDAVGRQTLIAR